MEYPLLISYLAIRTEGFMQRLVLIREVQSLSAAFNKSITMRPFTYKVSPAYIRNELDKRNIPPQVLAVLAGYKDKTSIYAQLRSGSVTQPVADALERLGIAI